MSSIQKASTTRTVLIALLGLALGAALLIAVPGTAQAQAFTVEVGTYTIPDNDGSVVVPVMVDPAGTSLAAVAMTIGYDATLVSVTMCEHEELVACVDDEAGEINIQTVTGDMAGFVDPFTAASITFQALGAERTEPLTVTLGDAFDADFAPLAGQAIDGEITVSSRAPIAELASDCEANDGRFTFTLDNPMDEAITYTISVDGVADTSVTLDTMTNGTEVVTGIADGGAVGATVTASGGFGTLLDTSAIVRCDAEASATTTCDGGASISVEVVNYSGSFATYAVTIGSSTQQRSISDGLRTTVTASIPNDGDIPVVVRRNGTEIFNEAVTVDCGNPAPTATPVPPTPTPVPPTPTPAPPTPTPVPGGGDDIIGADGPIEVMRTTTCLAGNGRADINIVNTSSSAAVYRIEFGSLSPRQLTVGAGDWWRMPFTGRPEGDHEVVVKRDGVTISDGPVTVTCDTDPPVVASPEVQVVNACRAGNGYILFQFANQTAAQRGWVIEFEGVPNRSTSAAAFAGSVRAVTGRQDGTYAVVVRSGADRMEFDITVACDA